MPRGVPNMPPGYMTPSQAAEHARMYLPNGKPNTAWIWKRLDPSHPDMIPHRNTGTPERPTYQIPIAEFEAWDKAHEVKKVKP
jgi:hypothetical protein